MKTLSNNIKDFRKALPRFSRLTFGLILVVLLGLTACQSQSATTETQLILGGGTTPQRVVDSAAELFIAQNPGITITSSGGGSTVGVEGAASGDFDIGLAGRPIRSSELEPWPELTTTTIGYDGIAVVVNRFVYANLYSVYLYFAYFADVRGAHVFHVQTAVFFPCLFWPHSVLAFLLFLRDLPV